MTNNKDQGDLKELQQASQKFEIRFKLSKASTHSRVELEYLLLFVANSESV